MVVVYDYDSGGRVADSVFTDNIAMFNGNAMYRGYRSATVLEEDCRFTMAHDTVSGTGGYMVARGKQIGACCIGTGCLIVDEQSCNKAGGSWLGPDTTCDNQMLACPEPNTGDINTDGVVDMMDLVLVMTSMNTADYELSHSKIRFLSAAEGGDCGTFLCALEEQ